MCRILVFLLIAVVLALLLATPALAKPSTPPCAYGQYWKYLNHDGGPPPGTEVSAIVHLVNEGAFESMGIYNWGDVVEKMSKPTASAWWAANH